MNFYLDIYTRMAIMYYLNSQLESISWENEDFTKEYDNDTHIKIKPKYKSLGTIKIYTAGLTKEEWGDCKDEYIDLLPPLILIDIEFDKGQGNEKYLEIASNLLKDDIFYDSVKEDGEKSCVRYYAYLIFDYLKQLKNVMRVLKKADELKEKEEKNNGHNKI